VGATVAQHRQPVGEDGVLDHGQLAGHPAILPVPGPGPGSPDPAPGGR
jgi:hypothetical protein